MLSAIAGNELGCVDIVRNGDFLTAESARDAKIYPLSPGFSAFFAFSAVIFKSVNRT